MGDKKKRGRRRKKVTAEQIVASKYINQWVFGDSHLTDEFVPKAATIEKAVFEFHSHSKCSDGFLSPSAVVERAHRNGDILYHLLRLYMIEADGLEIEDMLDDDVVPAANGNYQRFLDHWRGRPDSYCFWLLDEEIE